MNFNFLKKFLAALCILNIIIALPAKLHVVYHPNYNITFYGIPKLINLHAFDGQKYGKIYNAIKENQHIVMHTPHGPISQEDLLTVHTTDYLKSLQQSLTIAQIAEIYPLQFVPNFILQRALLNPIKWATQGTVDALELALKHGNAINLSGGYHHAKAEKGEGFCFYSDIAIAIKKFHALYPHKKVIIIDLDAHQGNGHESIFFNDDRVIIFDVFNMDRYPREYTLFPKIKYNFPLTRTLNHNYKFEEHTIISYGYLDHGSSYFDDFYLTHLRAALPSVLETEKPDLIVYVAGTDILENDPLGGLNVSKEGIIERDELVFKNALSRSIPIVMLLAGGYTQESANVVSDSIKNLQQKFFNNLKR